MADRLESDDALLRMQAHFEAIDQDAYDEIREEKLERVRHLADVVLQVRADQAGRQHQGGFVPMRKIRRSSKSSAEKMRSREQTLQPRVFDVIVGTFGAGLPHLVVKLAEHSVEGGAIHTYDDGREEITPTGTIRNSSITAIIDHWDDLDRITEAFANNMYKREQREDEVPRIREMVEELAARGSEIT